mmetsp:Transcript_20647/g.63095  ORF Transcript_20647/g.63095 Transcript_20647/m.63095 type:complete len:297 (+) Transcript_20647:2565-3455(+)
MRTFASLTTEAARMYSLIACNVTASSWLISWSAERSSGAEGGGIGSGRGDCDAEGIEQTPLVWGNPLNVAWLAVGIVESALPSSAMAGIVSMPCRGDSGPHAVAPTLPPTTRPTRDERALRSALPATTRQTDVPEDVSRAGSPPTTSTDASEDRHLPCGLVLSKPSSPLRRLRALNPPSVSSSDASLSSSSTASASAPPPASSADERAVPISGDSLSPRRPYAVMLAPLDPVSVSACSAAAARARSKFRREAGGRRAACKAAGVRNMIGWRRKGRRRGQTRAKTSAVEKWEERVAM